jgi:hypothetical protein
MIMTIIIINTLLVVVVVKVKGEGKGHPITGHEGPRLGSRGIVLLILNLGARRGGWSAPRPDRFTPGKDPVPIVQEAGWVPGPVWTCAKNLAPTGIFFLYHVYSSQLQVNINSHES